jgi:hypothetical protein
MKLETILTPHFIKFARVVFLADGEILGIFPNHSKAEDFVKLDAADNGESLEVYKIEEVEGGG